MQAVEFPQMDGTQTLFVFKRHWADSISIWKVLQTRLKSTLENSLCTFINFPLKKVNHMNKSSSNHTDNVASVVWFYDYLPNI